MPERLPRGARRQLHHLRLHQHQALPAQVLWRVHGRALLHPLQVQDGGGGVPLPQRRRLQLEDAVDPGLLLQPQLQEPQRHLHRPGELLRILGDHKLNQSVSRSVSRLLERLILLLVGGGFFPLLKKRARGRGEKVSRVDYYNYICRKRERRTSFFAYKYSKAPLIYVALGIRNYAQSVLEKQAKKMSSVVKFRLYILIRYCL